MTALERTRSFLAGRPVDRPPFHPIIMRWAARYAGVRYRDFCLNHRAKCGAMIRCAEDFDLDWVTVMSDPFCEASAFGLNIEYPEDALPIDRGGHLPDLSAARRLKPFRPLDHERPNTRLQEIREFRRQVGDRCFIVGWVEGPIAEYADLRGPSRAAMDLLDDPAAVLSAIDAIVESALEFITLQVEAGAHAVGIGDAFCSQIGPRLYAQFALDGERRMVERIHSLGAVAKLHICGNTAALLPDMIRTGADIVDVDHLVPDMAEFAPLLEPGQVLCGKSDPVGVIQDGTPDEISRSVSLCREQTGGRCIVSAGCEITPDTSADNLRAFRAAAGPCTAPEQTGHSTQGPRSSGRP
jgi:MtaA/CmuA family methyltransferase